MTKEKLHVKIGDTVTVISGFHKMKLVKLLELIKNGKIIVKGINFKHVKPNTENEIGEIKQFEAPIHHSNVKLNLKSILMLNQHSLEEIAEIHNLLGDIKRIRRWDQTYLDEKIVPICLRIHILFQN
jgi:ribosomal protein L24